jgi:hypothetical protein
MVKIETNPTLVEGQIINKVGARIVNYDLDSHRCIVHFKLISDIVGTYYIENWDVPTSILENWGTDDNIIFQAIADYKGFTLKE